MKQIKCKLCGKIWYLDNGEENNLKVCPFCKSVVRKKQKIERIKNLGEAIYYAISENGIDILTSVGKITGFMYDTVPELRKEIKIFAKTFDEEYLAQYREAFAQDARTTGITLNKLKEIFIEEEGLSETWADTLCANCYQAVRYYKGERLTDIMLVEITDWEFSMPEIENDYENYINEESIFELEDTSIANTIKKSRVEKSNKLDEEYKNGLQCEIEGDDKDALQWYGQSGYGQSYVRAAKLLDIKGNYKRAWMYIVRAAEMGDGEGLYYQGLYYQTGRHVKQNYGSAVTCYKKAIEKRNVSAYIALGQCYRAGIGITRDLEKAIEMFKTAAEAGDLEGKTMYNMYLKNK